MKRDRTIAITLGLLAGATLVAASAYVYGRHGRTSEDARSPSRVPVASSLIETAHPVLRSFTTTIPWIGVVQSQSTVRLLALETGRVESIEAIDEAPVKEAEVVMRLGGPLIDLQRGRLQSNLDALQARLDLASQTVQGLQEKFRDELATKEQVAAARQTKLQLQAQTDDAQRALDGFEYRVQIVASTSGVFTDRSVSVGQTVTPGDSVGDVVDPDHLRVVATLFPPGDVDLKGKQVNLLLGGESPLTATIRRVVPEAAPTGARRVWIEGPAIDRSLYIGQSVSGDVILTTAPAELAIPETAVVYDSNEQPYVFSESSGEYAARKVALGSIQDGWVQIRSGLTREDTVVTRGAYELFYREFNKQFKVED